MYCQLEEKVKIDRQVLSSNSFQLPSLSVSYSFDTVVIRCAENRSSGCSSEWAVNLLLSCIINIEDNTWCLFWLSLDLSFFQVVKSNFWRITQQLIQRPYCSCIFFYWQICTLSFRRYIYCFKLINFSVVHCAIVNLCY